MKRQLILAAFFGCAMLLFAPQGADAGRDAGPAVPAAGLPDGMRWVGPGVVRLSRYDPGGYLARYLLGLERLRRLGVRQLQLDATCASACTVYLRLGKRVCVTDRARLGFHRISLQARSRLRPIRARLRSAERGVNDRFLQRLPPNIRSWRGIRDGLPQRMVWLTGEEAARRIGRCR